MVRKSTTSNKKHLHFVGIMGVGMSSLALMAHELGYVVTGSDSEHTYSTESRAKLFAEKNIPVSIGFDAANLKSKPVVVPSPAWGADNVELKEAKRLHLPIKTYSEQLGELMAEFEGIGVTGVHGKTTTSAMLAYVLQEAGYSPSYSIGAPNVVGLKANGHIGDGKYFVAEADEYRKSEQSNEPKFLDLPLKHVIITSIELDHPDVYQTAEEVYRAFYRLSIKIPRDGTIIACTDWPLVKKLVNRRVDRHCLTYGFETPSDYQLTNYQEGEETVFSLKYLDSTFGPFTLTIPGRHNALNATAVIIMAMQLGVSEAVIAKALRTFRSPARRFQLLGEYKQAVFVDDYAHHPTAITYLLESARKRFPGKRIVAVFQPHTYSRTGKLLKEFAQSLAKADKVILLNIFASAREKSGYVTIKDLIDELKPLKPDVEYRPDVEEVAKYLDGFVSGRDVVLLIGAGDVYKVYETIRQSVSS